MTYCWNTLHSRSWGMLMAVQVKPYWVLLQSALRGDGGWSRSHGASTSPFPSLLCCFALWMQPKIISRSLERNRQKSLSFSFPCTLILSTSVRVQLLQPQPRSEGAAPNWWLAGIYQSYCKEDWQLRQMSKLSQLKLQLHPLPTLCQVSLFKCNLQGFKKQLFTYISKPVL